MLDLPLGRLIGWPLWLVTAALLRIQPVVQTDADGITAYSGWRAHVLSAGSYDRIVWIDCKEKVVRVRERRFWLGVRWRHIPFRNVVRVVYSHTDISPWSRLPLLAYQQMDMYTIAIKLTTGELVNLCRFCGPGNFINNTPVDDMLFWADEALADLTQGTQDADSRAFARQASRTIGVSLERVLN